MNTFDIHLQSAFQHEIVKNITSFVGEDAFGQFGILAAHARMMTCLDYGLAHYFDKSRSVEYLAIPGGVLYFVNNVLYINTRYYVKSQNYQDILNELETKLKQEDQALKNTRVSLKSLDSEMMKRLLELKRQERYEI